MYFVYGVGIISSTFDSSAGFTTRRFQSGQRCVNATRSLIGPCVTFPPAGLASPVFRRSGSETEPSYLRSNFYEFHSCATKASRRDIFCKNSMPAAWTRGVSFSTTTQDSRSYVRLKKQLKNGGFGVFESSRFVITER